MHFQREPLHSCVCVNVMQRCRFIHPCSCSDLAPSMPTSDSAPHTQSMQVHAIISSDFAHACSPLRPCQATSLHKIASWPAWPGWARTRDVHMASVLSPAQSIEKQVLACSDFLPKPAFGLRAGQSIRHRTVREPLENRYKTVIKPL